jgi:hypothetical protein
VTVGGIQSAIDYAAEKGSVVFLDNDSAKTEVIDFKTANVTIAGRLESKGDGTQRDKGGHNVGTAMPTVAAQPVTIDGAVTVNENATLTTASVITVVTSR